jgi:hypothetical protein
MSSRELEVGGTARKLAQDIQENVELLLLKNHTDRAALAALHRDAQALDGQPILPQVVQEELRKLEAKGHIPVVTIGESGLIDASDQHGFVVASPNQATVVEQYEQHRHRRPGDKFPFRHGY